MIRVCKSLTVPASLKRTANYDGEDVKRQLLYDQHEKCYICERKRDTDFEIEHYKSQKHYPELVQDWNNLFMGCKYCNGKKSDEFDGILCPLECNIEDIIEQRIDFANKRTLFVPKSDDAQCNETINLFNRIFNGTKSIRTIKEEKFIERIISVINAFSEMVMGYLNSPTSKKENAIREELGIDKELLGFKYWIIRDSPLLYNKFSQDIVWNKK